MVNTFNVGMTTIMQTNPYPKNFNRNHVILFTMAWRSLVDTEMYRSNGPKEKDVPPWINKDTLK